MAPFNLTNHVEDSSKRVRVLFGGAVVVDTTEAKLVWGRYGPAYYFPQSQLLEEYLQNGAASNDSSNSGVVYDLVVGTKKAEGAVTVYSNPSAAQQHLQGLVNIKFSAADAWFEEDDQLFIGPKNPYHRVDVLNSSRHIRIEIDGVEVANSRSPKLLYETGYRVRTYIPKTDCRLDLLVPSDHKTACPYKGEAHYYHVQLTPEKRVDNVVWWYLNPNLECAQISGLVAFYDEKLDVFVDGVKQSRS
ncbi:hypothetical protein FB45DRAFT_886862 [Roridomyces roridus]|uniref:DUF427 domain-containing protein n=1 Tax=Roridomyces roridus TaxID=1738132 RepID=A0AAD7CII1_9AGAR|nr:hypothetical protein FB45DRAFT_886862 [Roridomyces roridus]